MTVKELALSKYSNSITFHKTHIPKSKFNYQSYMKTINWGIYQVQLYIGTFIASLSINRPGKGAENGQKDLRVRCMCEVSDPLLCN